jgi:hypothetical protein
MQIRPDPDPEHCIYDKLFTLLPSRYGIAHNPFPFP